MNQILSLVYPRLLTLLTDLVIVNVVRVVGETCNFGEFITNNIAWFVGAERL